MGIEDKENGTDNGVQRIRQGEGENRRIDLLSELSAADEQALYKLFTFRRDGEKPLEEFPANVPLVIDQAGNAVSLSHGVIKRPVRKSKKGDGFRYQVMGVGHGKGGFGQVFKSSHSFTLFGENAKAKTRCRVIKKQQSPMKREYERTAAVHKKVTYTEVGDYSYLIMPNFGEHELHNFISKGRYNTCQALEVVCKLLNELKTIHDCQHVHMDIKPANVVCNLDDRGLITGDLKIVDLGAAQKAGTMIYRYCGTAEYCAPEVIGMVPGEGYRVDYAADIYSMGMVIAYILRGLRVCNEVADYVNQMCAEDPSMRPKLSDCIEFFNLQSKIKYKEDCCIFNVCELDIIRSCIETLNTVLGNVRGINALLRLRFEEKHSYLLEGLLDLEYQIERDIGAIIQNHPISIYEAQEFAEDKYSIYCELVRWAISALDEDGSDCRAQAERYLKHEFTDWETNFVGVYNLYNNIGREYERVCQLVCDWGSSLPPNLMNRYSETLEAMERQKNRHEFTKRLMNVLFEIGDKDPKLQRKMEDVFDKTLEGMLEPIKIGLFEICTRLPPDVSEQVRHSLSIIYGDVVESDVVTYAQDSPAVSRPSLAAVCSI